MFNLFRKITREEKLQKRYEKLMRQWAELSNINRKASDAKYAEAQQVSDEIEQLKVSK
ncbi:MAG: Lacal_2735 family protein [Bacteroidetes bacterium]|nr:Lacal_2735 family protein [Bacteroidota bacterium]